MSQFAIKNHDFLCNICVAEGASLTAMTAAGELARYLTRQSGRMPVVRIGEPQRREICLGAASADCGEEKLRLAVREGSTYPLGWTLAAALLLIVYAVAHKAIFRKCADNAALARLGEGE